MQLLYQLMTYTSQIYGQSHETMPAQYILCDDNTRFNGTSKPASQSTALLAKCLGTPYRNIL